MQLYVAWILCGDNNNNNNVNNNESSERITGTRNSDHMKIPSFKYNFPIRLIFFCWYPLFFFAIYPYFLI